MSSLFVEDALKITPNLTLVGGLRHDRTKVERRIDDLNAVTTSSFDTNYKSTSGRIGAVYNLWAQTSIYGQYSNATLPVGSLFLLSAGNASFPLSRGKQAEIGLKQSIPDASVEWTLAAYDIKLDNVLSRDANNAAPTVSNGKQSSRGWSSLRHGGPRANSRSQAMCLHFKRASTPWSKPAAFPVSATARRTCRSAWPTSLQPTALRGRCWSGSWA
nr:TonB-dependent receptor [Variovorax guangxiensis]